MTQLVQESITSPVMEKVTVFFKSGLIILGLVASASILTEVTNTKLNQLKELKGADRSFVTAADRERQLGCLAQNIYHEAGYESFEGKVAVAQVTLNRAASGSFPSDVCGVVYQKSVIYSKVICQFSWYCQQPTRMKPINNAAYNESMAVAKKVLLEGFKLDGLKTAMYYHADYVNPGWGKEKIATIGRHIFYSNRSAKGS
jgi:spore germination cell wall hydrolase CwlJ-like protein